MEKRMYVGGDAGRTLDEFIGDGKMRGRYVIQILRNKVFIYKVEYIGVRTAWNRDCEDYEAYDYISYHFPWTDVIDNQLYDYTEQMDMTNREYQELEQEWLKAQRQYRQNRGKLILEF